MSVEKLRRVVKAYSKRFAMTQSEERIVAEVGGGGYAYVRNETTGHVARYDISAWRIRYVDTVKQPNFVN